MRKPLKVLLGTPTGGVCHVAFMQSVFRVVASCNPDDIYIRPQYCKGSNIAQNQNKLARMAVEQGYDYLLLAETDVTFPSHSLARLVMHGCDIVGCSTPWKEHDLLADRLNGKDRAPRFMGHELDETEITMQSLIEGEPLRKVRFVPMGFTLIAAKAITAIGAYRREHVLPDTLRERVAGKWIPVFSHVESYPEDSDEGVISTSDSSFCANARDAGFDIWLDARLSLSIEHIGDCNYVAPEWMREREALGAAGKAA